MESIPLHLISHDRDEVDKYWKDRLNKMKVDVKEMEDTAGYVDPTINSILELMDLAVSLKQYDRPTSDYQETSRLVRIYVNAPRSVIEKVFGLKTVSVYGVGLYAVVDGLLLTESFRNKSNFDRTGKRGVYYDLSEVPEYYKDEYVFGLSIPAFEGLFVPKKSVLTSWISRSSQLQFFDLSI